MSDPVSFPASPTPVPTPVAAPVSPVHAACPSEEDASSAPGRAPLKIDVARGDDGVFVYTLSDPGTGAVLAVIPREAVRTGRDGRNLDQKV